MQHLESLKLAGCNITDRGIIAIIQSLDDLGTVINLDLSGNQIGKSAYFIELTTKLDKYISNNAVRLQQLYLNDNNLRSINGEKILKAICKC